MTPRDDIISAVNRRSFLRRGLFGGAILAAGGAGLALWPSLLERKPRTPLKALNEKEFAVLAAVASRTVRAEGADPVQIAHGVDDVMARAFPEVRSDFKKLLGLFENALAGLIFDGRPKPFTRLSPEAQDHVLENWRTSRIGVRRAGYQALRKLTCAAHYSQPSCWASVGYPGPPQISVPT
jgi:hypothetical protein